MASDKPREWIENGEGVRMTRLDFVSSTARALFEGGGWSMEEALERAKAFWGLLCGEFPSPVEPLSPNGDGSACGHARYRTVSEDYGTEHYVECACCGLQFASSDSPEGAHRNYEGQMARWAKIEASRGE
jgi:hypothetical protein